MKHLGQTRTNVTDLYAFIAPESHVELSLPGWSNALGTILISPQMGARFTHYLVHMQNKSEGTPPLPGIERFVFVLEGQAVLTTEVDTLTLEPFHYAYLPANSPHTISSKQGCKLNIFERRYLMVGNEAYPPIITGNLQTLKGESFLGDEDLIVKKCLPNDMRFDMAVNTMTFQPGTTLPFAESHFMEHGILMLSGEGIYKLAESWHPIQKDDVLWMGPYCPQWFGALGKTSASYLLYKEINRDVFSFETES